MTAIGAFAAVVSSYRRARTPLSGRVGEGVNVGVATESLLDLLRRKLLERELGRLFSFSLPFNLSLEVGLSDGDEGAILHGLRAD